MEAAYSPEIGVDNGRAASQVISRAPEIRYAGINISPTMYEEAGRFNAELIASGRASFHLCSAERMPFADATFDRVFAIGVIHFWSDPIASLIEIRRVMRANGLAIMGSLDPRSAAAFARPEFGFHLRRAEEWHDLLGEAGFAGVDTRVVERTGINPDGTPTKRHSVRITARA